MTFWTAGMPFAASLETTSRGLRRLKRRYAKGEVEPMANNATPSGTTFLGRDGGVAAFETRK